MKRGRPVYCRDPADWDRIRARAEAVGMSVSEFVITCALQDGTPPLTSPLVLTPEEQRDLSRNVRELNRRLVRLFFQPTRRRTSIGRGDPTALPFGQPGSSVLRSGQYMARLEKRTFYISCTDAEWEQAKRRAADAGMKTSPYLVERALRADLSIFGDRPPSLWC